LPEAWLRPWKGFAVSTPISPELKRELLKQFEDLTEARKFWSAHWNEFLQCYPEKYVAVSDGHVVATSTDFLDILSKIEELHLKPKDVMTQFVTDHYRRNVR
jgi:hypothetical protein